MTDDPNHSAVPAQEAVMKKQTRREENFQRKLALLDVLEKCVELRDTEHRHRLADTALIEYIGDADIAEAFAKIGKWYA